MSTPRLTVLGTGYLGATHAVCMAELGFEVLGMDVDAAKIAALASGRVPFFEPGLQPLLSKHLASGRLRFTTSYAEVAAFGDVHFLCVGTPQTPGSDAADLTYVNAVVDGLLAELTGPALLVGKSTVPVGTAEAIAAKIAAAGLDARGVELAWNPEFLREGFAVADTLRPDRLVFGVASTRAEALLREAFAPVIATGTPVVVTDFATAQLVKVAANSFLATKISFINAMAELCEATGGDVLALEQSLAHDARIGGKFLHAGVGFGGGCLPKDIRAFQARAAELGCAESVGFLREVDAINLRRRDRVVQLATELAGGSLVGQRIAVLGAAFKPNSDDIRDSPALAVATQLARAGADVVVYDPEAMDNARAKYPQLSYAPRLGDAVSGARVVLLLTEWDVFRFADPDMLGSLVAARNIVDGRNVLDVAAYQAAGWTIRSLGRASTATPAPARAVLPAPRRPHRAEVTTGPLAAAR